MITQWTVAGSPALEQRIDRLVLELRSRLSHAFAPEDYSVVVIAGGYGRGEGGVDTSQGGENLHNNLDLVWVARHPGSMTRIRERLAAEARYFASSHGITLDTFVIDEARLRRLPCLVMLYDMREGSRVLLGPPERLRELIPYGVADILPSDMRNLLINRGTLLLINRWLLSCAGQLSPERRQLIVRHAMKAMIGLGDALLFMRGEYHWSYQEKQRRMEASVDLPALMRQQYYQAAEFRYRPDYSPFQDIDLHSWNEDLIRLFERGHREYESWRLGATRLHWPDYPGRALRHGLRAEWGYRGTRLRRLKHGLTHTAYSGHLSLSENLGLRLLEPASLLALMFPLVAYDCAAGAPLMWVREQLNSDALTSDELLEDYLRVWGAYLDPSLPERLNAWRREAVNV